MTLSKCVGGKENVSLNEYIVPKKVSIKKTEIFEKYFKKSKQCTKDQWNGFGRGRESQKYSQYKEKYDKRVLKYMG